MAAIKPTEKIRIIDTPKAGNEAPKTGSTKAPEGFFGSPLHAIQASLNLIRSGGKLPTVAENVKRHIEGMMEAEGRKLAAQLPDVYREKLNGAIDAYRQAGRTEPELNGLRFAVAQKLTKMIG